MTVTKMERLSKVKMRVFLDGEPAFAASAAQIRLWGLYEGQELSEEEESRLSRQICMYAARTAVEILTRREYSAHDLLVKLRQKEFTPEAAEFALAYVRQKHFQDDLRYAESYIRSHSSKSRMQIRVYLKGHGLTDDIIEEALGREEKDDEDTLISELKKRIGRMGQIPEPSDPAYGKLVLSMQRRGFRYSDIRSALEEISSSEESD